MRLGTFLGKAFEHVSPTLDDSVAKIILANHVIFQNYSNNSESYTTYLKHQISQIFYEVVYFYSIYNNSCDSFQLHLLFIHKMFFCCDLYCLNKCKVNKNISLDNFLHNSMQFFHLHYVISKDMQKKEQQKMGVFYII